MLDIDKFKLLLEKADEIFMDEGCCEVSYCFISPQEVEETDLPDTQDEQVLQFETTKDVYFEDGRWRAIFTNDSIAHGVYNQDTHEFEIFDVWGRSRTLRMYQIIPIAYEE